MNTLVSQVTNNIIERSQALRSQYLADMRKAQEQGPHRGKLSCGNLAHGFAACQPQEKQKLKLMQEANIGIVSSYNDMLSAHQPYEDYPAIIRKAVAEMGSVTQFAGGVPAMCDGVTQGQDGMELSLFSRDNIAQGTAIALSHNMFDAALYLGICDKIVPGLLIGALRFGHLPALFVPAGRCDRVLLTPRKPRYVSVSQKARRPETNYWKQSLPLTTAQALVLFMAQPTPTSC